MNSLLQQKKLAIEQMRSRLDQLVRKVGGNVHTPEVKELSQQLDVLIVEYLRLKNHG